MKYRIHLTVAIVTLLIMILSGFMLLHGALGLTPYSFMTVIVMGITFLVALFVNMFNLEVAFYDESEEEDSYY